jgi:hypothetical protein
MITHGHKVAVAYRAFGTAQTDCQTKGQTGEIKTNADMAACLDKGLTSSKLEVDIEALRRDATAIGQAGSDACKTAANFWRARSKKRKRPYASY